MRAKITREDKCMRLRAGRTDYDIENIKQTEYRGIKVKK